MKHKIKPFISLVAYKMSESATSKGSGIFLDYNVNASQGCKRCVYSSLLTFVKLVIAVAGETSRKIKRYLYLFFNEFIHDSYIYLTCFYWYYIPLILDAFYKVLHKGGTILLPCGTPYYCYPGSFKVVYIREPVKLSDCIYICLLSYLYCGCDLKVVNTCFYAKNIISVESFCFDGSLT